MHIKLAPPLRTILRRPNLRLNQQQQQRQHLIAISKISSSTNINTTTHTKHHTIPHTRHPLSYRTMSSTTTTTSSSAPSEMNSILIKNGKGPASSLYFAPSPLPSLSPSSDVLIKIRAFGLNRMDLLQREGKYPLPPGASKTIMGVEFSGEVVDVYQGGEGVESEGGHKWKKGDAVFGLSYGGAYAEYISVSSKMIIPKPERLSWIEAAGVPENWLTAFQAMFLEGNFKPGSNILIHAGASGVGVAANQLALHFGAKNVFTTAGTDEKVKFLEGLASEGDEKRRIHAINYRTQDFEKEIKKIAPEGVHLVIDFIGPNYWNQNLNVLAQDGQMVILAFMSGALLPDSSLLAPILFKRLTIKGSTLRSRSLEYQGGLLKRFEKEALPFLTGEREKGGEYPMKVKVHEVFPWKKIVEAHEEMEANKNTGKIVLEIK